MGENSDSRVSRLIERTGAGDSGAPDELLGVVYEQLRAIARAQMADERPGRTIQATALVHEAYLRLFGAGEVQFSGRAHFFHAAAEAMRRILIDNARRRGAEKRGGSRRAVDLQSVLDLAAGGGDEIVSFDAALSRLESEAPLAAAVVRLRFFAGLTVEHAAEALGVSARTVNREWRFAKVWLYRALEGERGPPQGEGKGA